MNWLISTPVWGARCVEAFIESALPSIRAAGAGHQIRFLVHTDQPFEIDEALQGFERIIRPVPQGESPHHSAGAANREALEIAVPGEPVALINADMVCSREVFAAAEARLAAGKRMIMMAASRTLGGTPPIGAASADLLDWAMQHRHPAIVECFWPAGRSSIPWCAYFEQDGNIVLHGFHLHPFAVVKDRELRFEGATIDWDLADNYTREEIHLVTEATEASFAELSPPERVFALRPSPNDAADIAQWARHHATPLHRWLFDRRITIKGNGEDIGDDAVCNEILAAI